MKRTIFALLLVAMYLGSNISYAREVTFVLNDQYGNEIAGSAFYGFLGGSWRTISTGTSLDIADGAYDIRIHLGIGDANNYSNLHRWDQVEIDDSFTGQFEWITKTVAMSLNDQHGDPISGSAVVMYNGLPYLLNNNDEGTFPMTDEGIYPTIGGHFTEGINFQVRPGIGSWWRLAVYF